MRLWREISYLLDTKVFNLMFEVESSSSTCPSVVCTKISNSVEEGTEEKVMLATVCFGDPRQGPSFVRRSSPGREFHEQCRLDEARLQTASEVLGYDIRNMSRDVVSSASDTKCHVQTDPHIITGGQDNVLMSEPRRAQIVDETSIASRRRNSILTDETYYRPSLGSHADSPPPFLSSAQNLRLVGTSREAGHSSLVLHRTGSPLVSSHLTSNASDRHRGRRKSRRCCLDRHQSTRSQLPHGVPLRCSHSLSLVSPSSGWELSQDCDREIGRFAGGISLRNSCNRY